MIPSRHDAFAQLVWIAPGADSLVALASSSSPWLKVRDDPGAVLLLARQTVFDCPPKFSFCTSRLQTPALFDQVLANLDAEGHVNWNDPKAFPIYIACWRIARLASRVVQVLETGDPDEAWTAGMLAPLGWLAAAAVNRSGAEEAPANGALSLPNHVVEPHGSAFDGAGLARRLLRAWQLPTCLIAAAAHLSLPVETAVALGADALLFRAVQLAVEILRQHGDVLDLRASASGPEIAASLNMSTVQLDRLEAEALVLASDQPPQRSWGRPSEMPLLRELLSLAAENRRLRESPAVSKLEGQVDALHRTVREQHWSFFRRLEECKLSAMAEFAAGAGHEINNPLAVISGQAQYLLRTIEEEGPVQKLLQEIGEAPAHEGQPPSEQTTLRIPTARFRDCLQKSIQQTQRIHEVLRQLMQFARPSRPQKQSVDVVVLLREVLTAHDELALERKVRLVIADHGRNLTVLADPVQLRTALGCIVKNAIEAAGSGGWVNVRLEQVGNEQIKLVVEDSGPGPDRQQREHLFEPFYSGRQAGRGRGLGLPIAWRLAREQKGDVEFVPLSDGPTRFVVTLPAAPRPDSAPAAPAAVSVNGARCNGLAH